MNLEVVTFECLTECDFKESLSSRPYAAAVTEVKGLRIEKSQHFFNTLY